jgi:hypothetical protein
MDDIWRVFDMAAPFIGPKCQAIHWPLVAGAGLVALVLAGCLIVCLPAVVANRKAGKTNPEDRVQPAQPIDDEPEAVAAVEAPRERESTAPQSDTKKPTQANEPTAAAEPRDVSAPARVAETPQPAEATDPRPQPPDVKPRPTARIFKRRDRLTAHELRAQLRRVPEIHLNTVPGITAQLVRAQLAKRDDIHKAPTLLTRNASLAGLPLRQEDNCQLDEDVARNLQERARELHRLLDQGANAVRPVVFETDKQKPDADKKKRGVWKTASAIPTLMQLLQAEEKNVRLLLVDALAQIADPAAAQPSGRCRRRCPATRSPCRR